MDGTAAKASILTWLRKGLVDAPRRVKRIVLASVDACLVSLALWTVLSIRYGQPFWPLNVPQMLLFLFAPVAAVATYAWFRLYRLVTRFMGMRGSVQIFLSTGLAVLIWSTAVFLSGQWGIPRSIVIPFALLSATLVATSRYIAGQLLRFTGVTLPMRPIRDDARSVVIYGAGEPGVRLLRELRRVGDRDVVAFIDPSSSMRGQFVSGVKVFSPERLERIIAHNDVKEVLLALPHQQHRERRALLRQLEPLPVKVLVLPDYGDVTAGRVSLSDLRAVDVGDLLGRDPVTPNAELLARSIRGKSILVTGAGGSIGSELVRQILRQHPTDLVLFDISEVALYEIEMGVHEILATWPVEAQRPRIVGVLGSVLDEVLVSETIARYAVKTIYHAAAYKHVPIVESNVIAGIRNNALGMKVIAECACRHKVERLILISTDKAVRPTNVMGASKRLAELVLQALAAENPSTIVSMVRFGNVLDSSGSVVKRFRKQIAAGGPVTVTHKDIVRYFMSIPEAAELVIQASAMAKGGEVFVLEMGEPVRIDDLARLMIHLSGLDVRDEKNPDGDIEIVYTGLRPGEKLYEELLIGANTSGTEHPRIMRSNEPFLSTQDLQRELDILEAAMVQRDTVAIQAVLTRVVEGYVPPPPAALPGAEQLAPGEAPTIH